MEDGKKEERVERIHDMFFHPEPDKMTDSRLSPTTVTLSSQDFLEMSED